MKAYIFLRKSNSILGDNFIPELLGQERLKLSSDREYLLNWQNQQTYDTVFIS